MTLNDNNTPFILYVYMITFFDSNIRIIDDDFTNIISHRKDWMAGTPPAPWCLVVQKRASWALISVRIY